jgi:hypothetical protein
MDQPRDSLAFKDPSSDDPLTNPAGDNSIERRFWPVYI